MISDDHISHGTCATPQAPLFLQLRPGQTYTHEKTVRLPPPPPHSTCQHSGVLRSICICGEDLGPNIGQPISMRSQPEECAPAHGANNRHSQITINQRHTICIADPSGKPTIDHARLVAEQSKKSNQQLYHPRPRRNNM